MSFKKFKRLKENSQMIDETQIAFASPFNLLLSDIEGHSYGLKKHKDKMEGKEWTTY